MLHKNFIGQKAEELNFNRDTLEKVFRLTEILNFLNTDTLTKDYLALKGGTAINLTIFDLPRLSVDIDLDFTQNIGREEMMSVRDRLKTTLQKYMSANDYDLSPKSKFPHSLDSFVFTYTNCGGVKDNIKVEINYSLRTHILPIELIKTDILGQTIEVRRLEKTELFASKIVALLSRTAPRDLYDIHNMIQQNVFYDAEKELLKKCVVFYRALNSQATKAFDLSAIDALRPYEIKTMLLPVIHRKEFIDLPKMKKNVKEYLSDLLILTDEEKAFLQDFSNKCYSPEKLFSDTDILDRIHIHPMVEWKIASAKKSQK
ncbi:MAG: nucleotidyl transferase AbiEii/AbiGii toxin family protein [Alphaproteobacteria bacterium]|nr:nucleotidyl transferase AbiEii/AbiGii toxin family protein [Alphaproteobacteria bacterium]